MLATLVTCNVTPVTDDGKKAPNSVLFCATYDGRLMLQYAFNLFSHNSPMTENGYNEEEMKMVKETKKIWSNNDVNITATCIRVPIMRAHAESINLEFDRDVSEEEVRFWMIARFAVSHACAS